MPRLPYSEPVLETAISTIESSLEDTLKRIEAYLKEELAALNRDGQILVADSFNIDRINKGILPELQEKLREYGFGDTLQTEMEQLQELALDILEQGKTHGLPAEFAEAAGDTIEALLGQAQRSLFLQETIVAQELEEILVRNATGLPKYSDLIDTITKRLSIRKDQAITKADDIVSSFYNKLRVEHFSQRDSKGVIRGAKWWLYSGPRDGRNRLFCSYFAGTRVTIEILDSHAADYGRKHSSPPSVSLGGYNCRHYLTPLMDPKTWEQYPIGPKVKGEGKQ